MVSQGEIVLMDLTLVFKLRACEWTPKFYQTKPSIARQFPQYYGTCVIPYRTPRLWNFPQSRRWNMIQPTFLLLRSHLDTWTTGLPSQTDCQIHDHRSPQLLQAFWLGIVQTCRSNPRELPVRPCTCFDGLWWIVYMSIFYPGLKSRMQPGCSSYHVVCSEEDDHDGILAHQRVIYVKDLLYSSSSDWWKDVPKEHLFQFV